MASYPDPQGTALAALWAVLLNSLVESGVVLPETVQANVEAVEIALAENHPEAVEAWGRLKLRAMAYHRWPDQDGGSSED